MEAIIFSMGLPNNEGGIDIYLIPYSILALIGLFFVSRKAFIVLKARWKHRHTSDLP